MRQTIVIILLLGIVLALANVLIVTLNVCLLAFFGVLFGMFLNALSRLLRTWLPVSYHVSLGIVLTALVALSVGGCYLVGNQIASQLGELGPQLETSGQHVVERLREYHWARPYLRELPKLENVMNASGTVATTLLQGLNWLTWTLTGALVVFFVGIYVAIDPELYATGLVKLAPAARRNKLEGALQRLRGQLGKWIAGRLISMTIVGVSTTIALWLLGVPLAIALGLLAGLLSFVPNLGPVLAAIPQTLIAAQFGFSTAITVVVFNVALQGVESYVLTPLIQKLEVSMPPALIIFAQLLLGVIVGILGVIMAAPLVVVGRLLLYELPDNQATEAPSD